MLFLNKKMISVIIPTSSPSSYIEECLNSIDNQTISKEEFEVIIVLNGEKKPYLSYLMELLNQYNFCSKLLYTDVPGVSNARNIGMSNAEGEYICFVDDDDLVSNNYLEGLNRVCQSNTIAACNVIAFVKKLRDVKEDYISIAFENNLLNKTTSIFQKRSFLSTSWCKMIPVSIISGRKFELKFSIGEDALFMASISDKIQDIILTDSDVIYYRRLRNNSASRTIYPRKVIFRNKYLLIKEYMKLYMKSPLKYNLLLFVSRIIAVIKN